MLVERSKTRRRKKIVAWSSKRYDFVFLSVYLKRLTQQCLEQPLLVGL